MYHVLDDIACHGARGGERGSGEGMDGKGGKRGGKYQRKHIKILREDENEINTQKTLPD